MRLIKSFTIGKEDFDPQLIQKTSIGLRLIANEAELVFKFKSQYGI